MKKLEEFMKDRPHDQDKTIEEATIEYIEQIESKSIERYQALNQ